MATHVHQRAATGLIEVVEPVAVRAGVLFALSQVIDRSERAFAHELPNTLVLRREAQFLGVHQLPIMSLARRDHLVSLFEGEAERLLDDDVLAGVRGSDRDVRVQVVRYADVRDVAVCTCKRLVEIGEPTRNPVLLCERARVLLAPRIDAGQLGIGNEAVVGLGMDVGDEPGADQEDFGSAHGVNLQRDAYDLSD